MKTYIDGLQKALDIIECNPCEADGYHYCLQQDTYKTIIKKNIEVSRVELPVICSEAKPTCEPMYTLNDILKAVRGELTVAFVNDLTPEELKDKIYTVQGYIVCGVKSLANKIEPNEI